MTLTDSEKTGKKSDPPIEQPLLNVLHMRIKFQENIASVQE